MADHRPRPRIAAIVGGVHGHATFTWLDDPENPCRVRCECGWRGSRCDLAAHVNLRRLLLASTVS